MGKHIRTGMNYLEILQENQKIKVNGPKYEIAVLSNIELSNISEILEYYIKIIRVNPSIILGDYDNIVQDSTKYQNLDLVIIFWELSNLIEGLHFNIELLNDNEIEKIIKKIE